jgi:cupin fold WbuC family metalloprotein
MKYLKVSDEVLVADDNFLLLDHDFIDVLKNIAKKNKRKRVRICIHRNDHEKIQEMFIVHMRGAYIRPHKHLNKNESLHIIEGRAEILFFNEKGDIKKVIKMGNYTSGMEFYYKIEKPIYHSMIITSEYLVFQEITNGPFQRQETIFSPWSPEETQTEEVNKYVKNLKNIINYPIQSK